MDLMTSANRAPAMPVTPMLVPPMSVTPLLINAALITCTANGAGEWNEGTSLSALVPSVAGRVRSFAATASHTTIHNSIKKYAGVGHPPRGNPL